MTARGEHLRAAAAALALTLIAIGSGLAIVLLICFAKQPPLNREVSRGGWRYAFVRAATEDRLTWLGRPLPDAITSVLTSLLTPIGAAVGRGNEWRLFGGSNDPSLIARALRTADHAWLSRGWYDASEIDPSGPWMVEGLEGTPDDWVFVFRQVAGDEPVQPKDEKEWLAGRYQGLWVADRILIYRRPPTGAAPEAELLRHGMQSEPPGPWRAPDDPPRAFVYTCFPQERSQVGVDAFELAWGRWQGFWAHPSKLAELPWKPEFR